MGSHTNLDQQNDVAFRLYKKVKRQKKSWSDLLDVGNHGDAELTSLIFHF